MAFPSEFDSGPLELLAEKGPKPAYRTDLFSVKGFRLYNVLSREECAHYIQDSERLGYVSLEKIYSKRYRTNDRRIVMSPELASILWQRIGHFFREYRAGPADECFGVEPGLYEPIGLNECFKFCRYEPGGFFKTHYDGAFERNSEERSLFTVMIYLNKKDFQEGETEFVSNNEVQERVVPEPGMAVCFYHYELHQGAVVKGGRKYILRTDVMFRRRREAAEQSRAVPIDSA